MRRILSRLLFVFIICSSQHTSAAPPKFNPEKLAATKPAMLKFVDDGTVCGAVMAIGTADGRVYTEAVGKQTLESDKPMPKDAIFRIMSMTKPITAMGIMLLAEEGKLSIDDPVEKYLPAFKGQKLIDSIDLLAGTVSVKKSPRPITLRDLLTHTSGLLDYPIGLANLMRNRDYTLDELACILSQRPLDFEPGSKWKYSSSGIDILGRIIEVVSGQPYEEFLAQRFFQPLEMRDTAFYLTPEQTERLAEVCGQKDGKLVPADTLPKAAMAVPTKKPKYFSPSGGLYSTAADLGRLYQALIARRRARRPSHHLRKIATRDDAKPNWRIESWLHAGHGLRARLRRGPRAARRNCNALAGHVRSRRGLWYSRLDRSCQRRVSHFAHWSRGNGQWRRQRHSQAVSIPRGRSDGELSRDAGPPVPSIVRRLSRIAAPVLKRNRIE